MSLSMPSLHSITTGLTLRVSGLAARMRSTIASAARQTHRVLVIEDRRFEEAGLGHLDQAQRLAVAVDDMHRAGGRLSQQVLAWQEDRSDARANGVGPSASMTVVCPTRMPGTSVIGVVVAPVGSGRGQALDEVPQAGSVSVNRSFIHDPCMNRRRPKIRTLEQTGLQFGRHRRCYPNTMAA